MTAIWRKPAQLAAIVVAMLAVALPAIAQQPPPALMFWDLGTPNSPARYQPVSPTNPIPTSGQFFGTLITTPGANSYVVPAGVHRVLIDGCGAGGGNGLGQASANTAGGGGGGAAECSQGYPLAVTPGETLVVTVGAGVANATGGNTTITGADTAFPTLLGGLVGNIGGGVSTGVGGVGGNGAGPLASAGGASGTSATQPTGVTQLIISGPGGGGGGPTAATGGFGGTTGAYAGGSPGAGNGSGGGGGSTPFGNGGTGGVAGSPGATPTIGYGGGAGGNGSNSATTVAGANGFVLIRS
jgi:hypothetical protein